MSLEFFRDRSDWLLRKLGSKSCKYCWFHQAKIAIRRRLDIFLERGDSILRRCRNLHRIGIRTEQGTSEERLDEISGRRIDNPHLGCLSRSDWIFEWNFRRHL